MTDVVGLYLNPPQQAIVLCVDEKSQIQALERTQPGLPIKGALRDYLLRTITNVTERPPCSPRWTRYKAGLSANATRDTGTKSS